MSQGGKEGHEAGGIEVRGGREQEGVVLRLFNLCSPTATAPAEGVGMAWRRSKGRSQPHGPQSHGPAQDEAIDRVQGSGFQSTDDDPPWRREALAEAMERDDGLATLLSIVPG